MSQDIHRHRILILDFGSQYTQLIARRVREIGVYCEIYAWDVTEADIRAFNASGVILSGGPESVTEQDSPRAADVVIELDIPVLGICYGMQTMAAQMGGAVEGSDTSEFGYAEIQSVTEDRLFSGLADRTDEHGRGILDVWMSHGDKVTQLPEGYLLTAETDSCPIAAMAHAEKPWFGIQFHPEVTHTSLGKEIMSRFVIDICGCEALWTPANIVEDAIQTIRAKVGSDKVLLGLSGGVDSSVVAALLHKAIGDQLTCVFVDNGLLRLNEGDQVMEMFGSNMGVNVIRANAQDRFLSRLAGVSEPEAKRKIIGNTFIDVFDEEAAKLTEVKWLAQGTIYPDVIESAGSKTGKAHVIKSHHNVGGLPEDMALELVEPLRELFKDEVRQIGRELGLPEHIVARHPFPGPGLGIRIVGEVTEARLALLRQADAIVRHELTGAGVDSGIWQCPVVLLADVRSVGVQGDGRTYGHPIVLRPVSSDDAMTADWTRLDHELLATISNRITNEVAGVNRVVLDITSKPPGTIEWE